MSAVGVDRTYFDWPFFEKRHRAVAAEAEEWAAEHAESLADENDPDGSCRSLAASMGWAGLLRHAVPEPGHKLDVRAICLIREILARHAGLADFAFAMQGLGTGAITLFGTDAQRRAILPGVRSGEHLAAFALSEKEAGSDVSALATTATPDGADWVLDGEKTWISNGGIASHYVVFARTGPGTKGLSAFAVPADVPGLQRRRANRDDRARIRSRRSGSRTAASPPPPLIGQPGDGFRIALSVARRLPLHGRRGRARPGPPRARRSAPPRAHPPPVRRPARRHAGDASRARRHGHRGRRRRPACLSRRLDQMQARNG